MSNWFTRLFAPTRWEHPDEVDVPSRYAAQVVDAFWTAASKLKTVGHFEHSHKIKRIRIVDGTHKREKGWAVPAAFSPTGWAGGWCGSREIVLVCDPNNGNIMESTAIHEWAEALLWGHQDTHAIMRRAGM
jgi:hypothetical protein